VPGLVAFCGGPFAHELHRLGSQPGLELTLARLREMLGRDVPQPRAFAVTDWQGDPFSRGSYSNIHAGRTTADLDLLAEPVGGRILFAGEATNRVRHSTADGAMSSGIREAKRLLRAPAVALEAA
jgi:polyamine oxidase